MLAPGCVNIALFKTEYAFGVSDSAELTGTALLIIAGEDVCCETLPRAESALVVVGGTNVDRPIELNPVATTPDEGDGVGKEVP